MVVYLIRNTKTGERYVGKTEKTVGHRMIGHRQTARYRRSSVDPLYASMQQYGEDAFTVTIIDTSSTVEMLNDLETEWIDYLKPELNIHPGGTGGDLGRPLGCTWTVSDEGRANMREARSLFEESYKQGTRKTVQKISGKNNYQSIYEYHTPWGTFYTVTDACNRAKELRSMGRRDVVTDASTLKKYCIGVELSERGRRTYAPWRGKHTHQLGFNKTRRKT